MSHEHRHDCDTTSDDLVAIIREDQARDDRRALIVAVLGIVLIGAVALAALGSDLSVSLPGLGDVTTNGR